MPVIHLIAHDGTAVPLQVPEGHSVMQAAVSAGMRGIVGECGGSAMCATCHVYVDPAWVDKVQAALPNELEMLECTSCERRPESRLSCQIKVHAGLDGLVVRLPATQQ